MCTKLQSSSGLNSEDIENAVENEYCFLLRQHRIMESDRNAFNKEIGSLIRKQRALITSLRADKKELMTKVIVATCKAYENDNDQVNAKLLKALELSDKYDVETVKLREYITEVDHELHKVEREVFKLRLKVITDSQSQQHAIKMQRRTANLENQLNVANFRFNKVVAENRQLREEIGHILCERVKFNEAFYTLIGKLNEGKKCMLDLIELATLAYDQREEALTTLNSLQEKAAIHLATQSHEMSILERTMDNDLKLKEFLERKSQRRVMTDLEAKREIERACKRLELEEQIAKYESYLEEIRFYNDEDDVDIIAQYFLRGEEENFSMFVYLINLNEEMEALDIEVNKYREKIDEHRAMTRARERSQKEKISQMTTQLDGKSKNVDKTQALLSKRKETLAQLLTSLDQLFIKVKGDRAPIKDRLGVNYKVTRHNYMLHLQEIEHKVNQLMTQVYYIEKRTPIETLPLQMKVIKEEHRRGFKAASIEVVVPTQPCALCVEQEEMSKLEEVEIIPLTRQGLEHKLEQDQAMPDFASRLHNLSACRLPRSRKILQRRYM